MPVENKMSEPYLANVPTRERILAAAADLFYARGLRSVSADKIIERVGNTKVTFYRHFRTKDDLVVAYLERQAERERADVAVILARAGGEADEALRLFAENVGAVSCAPGFRGILHKLNPDVAPRPVPSASPGPVRKAPASPRS